MQDLLNKEPVRRVIEKLKNYSSDLEVAVLNQTARTAVEAAKS